MERISALRTRQTTFLKNAEAKASAIRPEAEQYTKEFEDAVQQQYAYLKKLDGAKVLIRARLATA